MGLTCFTSGFQDTTHFHDTIKIHYNSLLPQTSDGNRDLDSWLD